MPSVYALPVELAQVANGDWTVIIDRYGLPLAFIAVVMIGKFVPGFVYERRYQEVLAERAKNEELERMIRTEVVPALVSATEASKTMLASATKLMELLPRLEALIMVAESKGEEPPR